MAKSDLDPYQREKLDDLLAEYSCIFAENPKKPAITSLMKHGIDTGNFRPVKQSVRSVETPCGQFKK